MCDGTSYGQTSNPRSSVEEKGIFKINDGDYDDDKCKNLMFDNQNNGYLHV